ncbi:hypothetical protein P7K49_004766 [Saguinus oedipus]|uniref:C2H2-type domain-containing protein n=1 Tax=Saguinus oedipus TaxID=9490 RepID=A0ABQ9WA02_SAGOE|nr:hypothetical protein P7K49_004766 [Saguinus oedipus]
MHPRADPVSAAAEAATADLAPGTDLQPGEPVGLPRLHSRGAGPTTRRPWAATCPIKFMQLWICSAKSWKPRSISGRLETSQATSCRHPFCHRLPSALHPQARAWLLPEPFLHRGARPAQGKEKPPNTFAVDVKPNDEAVLCKHKCQCCSKVFGADSSLQIRLCSHTGERPFVCSVCDHRFPTKDDLKGSLLPTSPGLPENPSLETKNLMGGPPLPSNLQPGPSPESEGGSTYPGVVPNHNSPRTGGFQGSGTMDSNESLICHRVLSCQSSLKDELLHPQQGEIIPG